MPAIFSFFPVAMASLWLTLPLPPTCSMILPHHLFFLLHLQTLLLKHEKPSFYSCFPLASHSLSSFSLIAKSFKCSIFADYLQFLTLFIPKLVPLYLPQNSLDSLVPQSSGNVLDLNLLLSGKHLTKNNKF